MEEVGNYKSTNKKHEEMIAYFGPYGVNKTIQIFIHKAVRIKYEGDASGDDDDGETLLGDGTLVNDKIKREIKTKNKEEEKQ